MSPEQVPVLGTEHNRGAGLTDGLQDSDDRLKVAYVINGELKVDVTKVSYTIIQTKATSRAVLMFDARTHLVVKDAIRHRDTIRAIVIEILSHNLQVGRGLNLLWRLHPEADMGNFVRDISLPVKIFDHL